MNKHPDNNLLEAYASGSIDAVSGLVVATHLETCSKCRAYVNQLEAAQADVVIESSVMEYDVEFDSMFNDIITAEPKSDSIIIKDVARVAVAGKDFKLPKTLSRFSDLVGEWKSYGGKVYSAQIDLGEDARVNLMYISEDVRIPQHTHKGQESTLVLHGGFSDEDGHYEVGDVLVRDASVKHSPFTKAGEDCLCLTVLTEPMIFTQGVARIFNLFGKGMYP
ncbi:MULTISPECIES: ChrR family anti-sigma-E factor [Vibrio]|uniref:Transcriptional regulator n=1 Tax=Vibrio hyugaensis TaxID=1534743 RepID=A0ABQ5Y1E3_9VIBR|nr:MULTISPECIES: ChrR family anti-sigma-E factor [Vibrio]MCF6451565.1 ChrR family anti-sigma-E factor [Vibrio sp. MMG023]MCX2790898.1 ChrR family anti-sigma-E factor [Vibrio sp. Sgm 5]PAW12249.1 transcriptional regulator [Vibrio sp. V1B]PQJ58847.1 transcriptional regulator [Vibrio jasicida]UQA50411.1 ChrR family anti-sigma-E factor [Vibrio sp. ED002]